MGAEPITTSGIRSDLLHSSDKSTFLYDPYCPFWLALGLHFQIASDYVEKGTDEHEIFQKHPTALVHHPDDVPITHNQFVYTKVLLNEIEISQLRDAYLGLDPVIDSKTNAIDPDAVIKIDFCQKANGRQLEEVKVLVEDQRIEQRRKTEGKRRKEQSENKTITETVEENLTSIRELKINEVNSSPLRVNSRRASITTRSLEVNYLARILDSINNQPIERHKFNRVMRRSLYRWRSLVYLKVGGSCTPKHRHITKTRKQLGNKANRRMSLYSFHSNTETITYEAPLGENINDMGRVTHEMRYTDKKRRDEILSLFNQHKTVKRAQRLHAWEWFWSHMIINLLYLVIFSTLVIDVTTAGYWGYDFGNDLRLGLSSHSACQSSLGEKAETVAWLKNSLLGCSIPLLKKKYKLVGGVRICQKRSNGLDENRYNGTYQPTYSGLGIDLAENEKWTKPVFWRNTSLVIQSDWPAYNSFCIDFSSNSSSVLNKLQNDGWVDKKSVGMKIRGVFFSLRMNSFGAFEVTLDFPPTERVKSSVIVSVIKNSVYNMHSQGVFDAFIRYAWDIISAVFVGHQLLCTIVKIYRDRIRATAVMEYKAIVQGAAGIKHNRAFTSKKKNRRCFLASDMLISWTTWISVWLKSLREPDTESMTMELSYVDILMQAFGISSIIYYLHMLNVKEIFYQQSLHLETKYPSTFDTFETTYFGSKYVASLWILFSWLKVFEIMAFMPRFGKILLRVNYVLVSIGVVSFALAFLMMMIPVSLLYQVNFGSSSAEFSNFYNAYRSFFVLGVTGEHKETSYDITTNYQGQKVFEQVMFFILFFFVCLFSVNMLIAVVTDKWSLSANLRLWSLRTNQRLRMEVTSSLKNTGPSQKKGRCAGNKIENSCFKCVRGIVRKVMNIAGFCYGHNKEERRGVRSGQKSSAGCCCGCRWCVCYCSRNQPNS